MDVFFHGKIHRERFEIWLHHTEICFGFLFPLPFVRRPLEVPIIHHTDPGPVSLDAFVCHGNVLGLLLRRNLSIPLVRDGIGNCVPVHLRYPDGFVGVAVLHHDIPDIFRPGKIDDPGIHPPVRRTGPKPISLHRHYVKAVSGSGVVHPLKEDEVIHVTRAKFDRAGEGSGHYYHVGIHGFRTPVGCAQKPGVRLGINRLIAPLGVNVRLIPYLIVTHFSLVPGNDSSHEIAEIVEVIRGSVGAYRISLFAAPRRRVGKPHYQFDVIFAGKVHDLIVFLPRRMIPLVVPEIPLAADLDIFPGKFLPDPMKTGLGDHFHRKLALGRVGFLFEESVDSKRIHVGITNRCHIPGLRPGAEQIGRQVGEPLDLL